MTRGDAGGMAGESNPAENKPKRSTIRLKKSTGGTARVVSVRQNNRRKKAAKHADSGTNTGKRRGKGDGAIADNVWRAPQSSPQTKPNAKAGKPTPAPRATRFSAGSDKPSRYRQSNKPHQSGKVTSDKVRNAPARWGHSDAAKNTLQPTDSKRQTHVISHVTTRKAVESTGATKQATQKESTGAGTRLNRYLAQRGYCSRREADVWIERGWVMVNGVPAQMGQRVTERDLVHVEQQAQQRQAAKITILMNKPIGYVSGQAEDGYEPASVLVTPANRWKEQPPHHRQHVKQADSMVFAPAHRKGLAVAGRLDIDSTGLLVLTQDGRIAKQLIGENADTEKEYLVRVRYQNVEHDVEAVFPAPQLQRLRHGLSLDGKELKPAQVQWQNPEQLRFVLREGKKRQIRRMCEAVGLYVVGLKRVRIGKVRLGKLPQGKWRYLLAGESF